MKKQLFFLLLLPLALLAQQSPYNRYPAIREALSQKYEIVSPFYAGGQVIVSQAAKYGYVSAEGKEITPFIYDEALYFEDGAAEVQQNGLWGCINAQGQEIIPCAYKEIEQLAPHFWVLRDTNEHLRILTKPYPDRLPLQATQIKTLQNIAASHLRDSDCWRIMKKRFLGVAVESEGKWGMIDANGKWIVPSRYDALTLIYIDSTNGSFLVQVSKDKQNHLFNTQTQQLISPPFDYIYYLQTFDEKAYFSIIKNEMKGIIRSDGEMIIPFAQQRIEALNRESTFFMIEKEDKKGLLSPDFKLLTPIMYDYIEEKNGIFTLENENENAPRLWLNIQESESSYTGDQAWINADVETTVLNPKREQILPPNYWFSKNEASDYYPFFIFQKQDSFGLMRSNGELKIPLQKKYAMVKRLVQGLRIANIMAIDTLRDTTRISKNTPFSANEKGIIKVICDDGTKMTIEKELKITLKYGYADTLGKVWISCKYEDIESEDGLFFAVQQQGKWGVINLQQQQILPFEYEKIALYQVGNKAIFVTTNTKKQQEIWNSAGKKTINKTFEEVEARWQGKLLFFCKDFNGKATYILNKDGKHIRAYPLSYTSIDEGRFDFFAAYTANTCDVYVDSVAQPFAIGTKNRTFFPTNAQSPISFWADNQRQLCFWEKEQGKWYFKNLKQQKVLSIGFDELIATADGTYIAHAYRKDSLIWGINMKSYGQQGYDLSYQPATDTILTPSGTRFVRLGDLWKCEDAKGRLILPLAYEDLAYNTTENVAVLRKSSLKSLLDSTQKPLLSDCQAIKKTETGFRYQKGGLWGLADSAGNSVFPPVIDDFKAQDGRFETHISGQHLFWAEQKGLQGMLTAQGKWWLKPEYEEIKQVTWRDWLLRKKGKAGILDTLGREIVPCIYDYLSDYTDSYREPLPFYTNDNRLPSSLRFAKIPEWVEDFTFMQKEGNFHLINLRTGKNFPLERGMNPPAIVLFPTHFFIVKDTDFSYLFDTKGNFRFKIRADLQRENKVRKYQNDFSENIELLLSQYPFLIASTSAPKMGEEWGADAAWGFDEAEPVKYGIVDTLGKEILPLEYDIIGLFSQGFAPISQNKKYGLLDSTGKFHIPLSYDTMARENGFYFVGKGEKNGILAHNGREIVPCLYDKISSYDPKKGYFKAQKGEKWAVIDTLGREILPFEYETLAQNSVGGLWVAMKNKHCGIIRESDKKQLIPFEYEGLQIEMGDFLDDTLLIFQQNCLYGLMQLNGKIIAEAQYLFIRRLEKSALFVLCENKQYHLLDPISGQKILQQSETQFGLNDCPIPHFLHIYNGSHHGLWNQKTHSWVGRFYRDLNFVSRQEPTQAHFELSVIDTIEGPWQEGIMDREGKWFAPPQEGHWEKEYGFYVFMQAQKSTLFDADMRNILPLDSGYLCVFRDINASKTYFIRRNQVLSDKGETVTLPISADDAMYFGENIFSFKDEKEKRGFVSLDGKLFIPPSYDRVYQAFDKGIAKVGRNGVAFFIDTKGNIVGEAEGK